MPSFLSKVFKGKDGAGTSSKSSKHALEKETSALAPQKPRWEDAWLRNEIEAVEVHELLRGCTQEMKSRALDLPFLLLPFRPTSDPSAAKTFVRNFFNAAVENTGQFRGEHLKQELRLTEPMVLCSVMKWCWSRLPGGVVGWEAYELFRIGEDDSEHARDAFATFIPLSVETDAQTNIIFDFFDLLAAIAAHGKTNGLGGGKLSRLAGWWAFEHSDSGDGFDGGYRSWASAADATSHLFFAYLRSLSPDTVKGISGISTLPLSLQALLQSTDYPPGARTVMQSETNKVVMIVDSVSPTPFSLLRRAKHFEYRDDDEVLRHFAEHIDPVQALTEECHRVLNCISSTNQSATSVSNVSPTHQDTSWSRFEDMGFSGLLDENRENETPGSQQRSTEGLRSTPHSQTHNHGRPTTPSWADFLSSGFVDEAGNTKPASLHLPPDKMLPPIATSHDQNARVQRQIATNESDLEPGELASITRLGLDDSFWWVWITSLAGEETIQRKAVFGRCALIETSIAGGRWLVFEEKVKGTVPTPDEDAYVVEKKSRFNLAKRVRGKSYGKKNIIPPRQESYSQSIQSSHLSKTSIGPDQHARIQAAAAALQKKQAQFDVGDTGLRRGRKDDARSNKTNSIFTLQPVIINEASPAMQWANEFDKDARRAAYLGDNFAGRSDSSTTLPTNGLLSNGTEPKGTPVSSPPPNPPRKNSSHTPAMHPERTLTPPPLPATPVVEKGAANGLAAEAAEVPLPTPTPMERQPLTPVKQAPSHPAYRQTRVLTDPTLAASAAKSAWLASNAAPQRTQASQSPPANKLQKRGGGGGFTKLFGKKHVQQQEMPLVPQGATSRPSLQVPQQSTLGRRFSTMRKKSSPVLQQQAAEPLHENDSHNEPASITAPPTPAAAQNADTEPHPYKQFQPDLSLAETNEQRPEPSFFTEVAKEHADQPAPLPDDNQEQQPQRDVPRVEVSEESEANPAFQSIDQGTYRDAPAFVSDDSPERGVSPEFYTPAEPEITPPSTEKSFQTRAAAMLFNPASAADQTDSNRVSEISADEEPVKSAEIAREVSPVDRWAQIRKNAAERAAARENEEQFRLSQSVRTEEDEAGGEETIESRVARIKARVAELTGNMDGQNTVRR